MRWPMKGWEQMQSTVQTTTIRNSAIANIRKTKEKATAVLTVVIFYATLQLFGITCPIKFLTGVSCAGCGTTRAWLSLLKGDIQNAFYYHPLFWMPPIALFLYLKRSKINKQLFYAFIFLIILAYAILYLFRLKTGCSGNIVVFEPWNGLIGRGIRCVVKILQSEV